MSGEIDTRIAMELHPETLTSLEGYSEDTKGHIGLVETAFSEAYEGFRAIHEAKAVGLQNPSLTDGAKLIQIDDYATKRMERITKGFDRAHDTLKNNIAFI